MGNKTWIKRNELPGRWERATGERHTFQLKRRKAYMLEVRDLHFHHDSAVLLPHYEPDAPPDGKKPFGFDALRTCYLHAKEHPERKILLAGHADTTGADAYNVTLSEKRADSVLYALLGKRDDWVKIALEKHKIEDYQLILKWVDALWKWGCDPGAVDNKKGPKTKKAVETFQKQYNAAFDAKIAEDGVVGKQTWQAIFDVYMEVLASSLDTDRPGLAKPRADLRFFDSARQAVGCGENWPIEKPLLDEYKSRTNRRVEIVFIEPSNEPKLECHPSKGKCVWEKCELYDPKPFEIEVIPVKKKTGTQGPYKLMIAADERAKVAVLVKDGDGTVVRRLEEKKEGKRQGGTVVFDLEPEGFPTPTQLVVEQWGFEYPHGVTFDPKELREALAAGDNARAAAVIYGEEEDEKKEGTKLFAWEPPAPKTATDVKDRLRVLIDTSGGIDLNHRLVKGLGVTLDGKDSETKKGALVGDFELTLPGKTEYELKFSIPGFDKNPLDITQPLKFEKLYVDFDDTSKFVWLLSSKTHPRLNGKSVGGSSAGGATVWTMMLDVSFLPVTDRTKHMNPEYQNKIVAKIDTAQGIPTEVREDPQQGGQAPMTYLLVNAPKDPSSVNVFLYFQNEAWEESPDHPDSDRHEFNNSSSVLSSSSSQGRYGAAGVGGFRMYPVFGWAAQVKASGADVLLVMPYVANYMKPQGRVASFGNLGYANWGVKRIRKLVFMLWADRGDWADQKERKLGKLLIGGWSSGMNTVSQWFGDCPSWHLDPSNRLDAILCFDAVGAMTSSDVNGKGKILPSPDSWKQWLTSEKEPEDPKDNPEERDRKKKKKRMVAFISGGYSEEKAISASQAIDADRILLNEPNDRGYWYDNPVYKWAHHDATFPALPVDPADRSPNTVYFAGDNGKKRRSEYELTLAHVGANLKDVKKETIAKVSLHEAADLMYHYLAMPKPTNQQQFLNAVAKLQSLPGDGEKEPTGRVRHPWTVFGMKEVKTQDGTVVKKGYLQLILERAVEKGLL